LTFFARISRRSALLQKASSLCYKTCTFSPPFCAPMAQGPKILTHDIWVRPTCACKILLGPVKPRLHDTTGCQTGCQTGLATGCIVYTNIQPRVWQPDWQPAVSCKRGIKVCLSYSRKTDFEQIYVLRCHDYARQRTTRVWASAQRDGRPAEYRRRPLFNAAKFGWRPLLECCAVTLRGCDTRWNLLGCPKLRNGSQPFGGPKFTILWDVEEVLLFNNFFRLSIHALVPKI